MEIPLIPLNLTLLPYPWASHSTSCLSLDSGQRGAVWAKLSGKNPSSKSCNPPGYGSLQPSSPDPEAEEPAGVLHCWAAELKFRIGAASIAYSFSPGTRVIPGSGERLDLDSCVPGWALLGWNVLALIAHKYGPAYLCSTTLRLVTFGISGPAYLGWLKFALCRIKQRQDWLALCEVFN